MIAGALSSYQDERQSNPNANPYIKTKKAESPKRDPNLMLTYGLLLAGDQQFINAMDPIRYALANKEQLDDDANIEQAQQLLDQCTEKIQLRLERYRQQLKDLEDQ